MSGTEIQDISRAKRETLIDMAGRKTLPHAIILEGDSNETDAAALETAHTLLGGALTAGALTGEQGSPDIIEIAPEKDSLGVDALRKVRFDAYIRPNQSEFKIYIIHSAGTMTEGAQNALLKVLEEPPAYVRFMLLCRSAAELLPTVRSRAVIFSLGAARQEKPENAEPVLQALAARDSYGLLRGFTAFDKDKSAQYDLLKYMQMLLVRAAGCKLGSLCEDEARELCGVFTAAELAAMSEVCGRAVSRLDSNVGAALNFAALTAELF